MKLFRASLIFSILLLLAAGAHAQDVWPKTITANDGTIIKVYQPQPESLDGNILKSRSVISIQGDDGTEPLFGTFWAVSTVQTDRVNRRLSVVSVHVPNLRFASDTDASKISYIKTTLESKLPDVENDLSLDAITASLDTDTEQKKLSKGLNNNVPQIFYSNKHSILVIIDGEPKLQRNKDWGVDAVVNTPFTIVKNNDGNFYLYGEKHWYRAPAATGPYTDAWDDAPANLHPIADAVDNNSTAYAGYANGDDDSSAVDEEVVSDIIVSTKPAELIQTNGDPVYSAVDGTNLQYIANTENDVFLNQGDQQYYVLLSGRWYKSASLQGPWAYNASNALPADFARIPEGSEKDNVLASIAGTDAAREAVMDAQIPQTAKVDRHNAQADVSYDGQPQFDAIEGTDMQYGVNTQNSVIRYRGTYYTVDKGVWFESFSPNGPWTVSTERPAEVDIIPPSSPVYNVKYVYIYDATPDWVYTGYTPGYLNTFIYGSTVVYGTGFYYQPWYGNYYYPRPYTYGFGVQYNPWAGYSLGYNYGYGWFNSGYGISPWRGWHGGWFGPSVYRPPYQWGNANRRSGGYYGASRVNAPGNVRVYNNVNIYNHRRNVVTINRVNNTERINRNRNNGDTRRPGGVADTRRQRANVYSDRQGNVYERNAQGQWQQRQQRQWKPVDNNNAQVPNLDRQNRLRDRGNERTQAFENRVNTPQTPAQRPVANPRQAQLTPQQQAPQQNIPQQNTPQRQQPPQRVERPVQQQQAPVQRPQAPQPQRPQTQAPRPQPQQQPAQQPQRPVRRP